MGRQSPTLIREIGWSANPCRHRVEGLALRWGRRVCGLTDVEEPKQLVFRAQLEEGFRFFEEGYSTCTQIRAEPVGARR